MIGEGFDAHTLVCAGKQEIKPDSAGSHHFDIVREDFGTRKLALPVRLSVSFLRAFLLKERQLDDGFADVGQIRYDLLLISHVFYVLFEQRSLRMNIAGESAGYQNLRARFRLQTADDGYGSFQRDIHFVQELSLIDAQSSVFTDIGNLILYLVEKTPQIMVLSAAGRRKDDAAFFQFSDDFRETLREVCHIA